MSMFPGPGAEIHYNEEGEVLGWDYPDTDGQAYYCDVCGISHIGACRDPYDEYDESEEDSADIVNPDLDHSAIEQRMLVDMNQPGFDGWQEDRYNRGEW